MRRRSALVSAAGLAATLPALTFAQSGAATTWRVQALYSPGNQVWDELALFANKVRALTGGRLAIQLLPAGGAVAVGGTFEAVRAGVLDGHISDPSLWNGVDAGFGTLGNFPGSFDTFYQLANYYYDHGGLGLLREVYASRGMYAVGVATGGPEALVSNRPLPSVAELKGLKVRSSPGISAQVFQKLGAGAVNIPFAEVFAALDKSVVDAADAGSLSFNDQIGLYAKSKHVVLHSPHSVAVMDFTVNQSRWDALAPDLKEIVQMATRELFFAVMSRVERDDAKVLSAAAQKSLNLWTWDAANRGRYRAAALEVWNEWATRSPSAKKVVDHQVAYLRTLGLL